MPGTTSAADLESLAQGVLEIVGPDLEALLIFYLEVGFALERRTPHFAVLRWPDGTRLFLAENSAAPILDRWAGLRIVVDDIQARWDVAQARHAAWISAPLANRGYGLLDFTLTDPAGFTLRFAQPVP